MKLVKPEIPICRSCNGNGSILVAPSYGVSECEDCGGMGKMCCLDCEGTGKDTEGVTCELCNGCGIDTTLYGEVWEEELELPDIAANGTLQDVLNKPR